jgi:hypothetical protein
MSEGEEGPDERSAGSPGVECGEDGKLVDAEVDGGGEDSEEYS